MHRYPSHVRSCSLSPVSISSASVFSPDSWFKTSFRYGSPAPWPRLPCRTAGCPWHGLHGAPRTASATSSVPCRTSTASIHAKCSLPDLNREYPRQVFPAGPQPRLPDRSGHCRTSTGRMSEKMSDRMSEDMPDRMPDRMPERMSEDMSEDMPDRMPERMSERMSEDMPEDMPD